MHELTKERLDELEWALDDSCRDAADTRALISAARERDDLRAEIKWQRERIVALSEALRPFTVFACSEPEGGCSCHNCTARNTLNQH